MSRGWVVLLILLSAALALRRPRVSAATMPMPPTGDYRPSDAPVAVDTAIRQEVAKYGLPRWFYYALIERESSFNPQAYNPNGGYGLTQLTGSWYSGSPYPENLRTPDDSNRNWRDDMNIGGLGPWIKMSQVTALSDPFNIQQNLERFSTGYAVPAFKVFKQLYGASDTETLRHVAFSWNKGVYKQYDPNNQDYLGLYDQYVQEYKPRVEAQDGVWKGLNT